MNVQSCHLCGSPAIPSTSWCESHGDLWLFLRSIVRDDTMVFRNDEFLTGYDEEHVRQYFQERFAGTYPRPPDLLREYSAGHRYYFVADQLTQPPPWIPS